MGILFRSVIKIAHRSSTRSCVHGYQLCGKGHNVIVHVLCLRFFGVTISLTGSLTAQLRTYAPRELKATNYDDAFTSGGYITMCQGGWGLVVLHEYRV
jgi:hypothetical protein